MARKVEYPRKPFETAIGIAENIEKLGGKCSEQLLADKLGKKMGGSFSSDINSAIKHGLIHREKEILKITDLFKNIQLSYSEKEKKENLLIAFLLPETYKEILDRFNKNELPIDVLDKMLIKEYGVVSNISKSVANNLIKGAESLGIIREGKVYLEENAVVKESIQEIHEQQQKENIDNNQKKESTRELISKEFQKDVIININIQLSVPETTNEEVYEKFFAAMKKHILS